MENSLVKTIVKAFEGMLVEPYDLKYSRCGYKFKYDCRYYGKGF